MRALQWLLSIQGWALLLGGGERLQRAGLLKCPYWTPEPSEAWVLKSIILACGVCCLAAEAGLARRRKWARGLTEAICVFDIVFPPILTLVGVVAGCLLIRHWSEASSPVAPAPVGGIDRRSKWIASLIAVITTAAGTVSVLAFCDQTGTDKPELFTVALTLALGWPALVIVHEGGHLIFGLAAGFRLRWLSVGPFALHRLADGWRARFDSGIYGSGGATAMVPQPGTRLAARHAWLIVGGPAATLVSGAACFWLFLSPAMRGSSAPLWGILGFASLLLFATSAVPLRDQFRPNDAALLLQVLSGGQAYQRMAAVLEAAGLDHLRPGEWDARSSHA